MLCRRRLFHIFVDLHRLVSSIYASAEEFHVIHILLAICNQNYNSQHTLNISTELVQEQLSLNLFLTW